MGAGTETWFGCPMWTREKYKSQAFATHAEEIELEYRSYEQKREILGVNLKW